MSMRKLTSERALDAYTVVGLFALGRNILFAFLGASVDWPPPFGDATVNAVHVTAVVFGAAAFTAYSVREQRIRYAVAVLAFLPVIPLLVMAAGWGVNFYMAAPFLAAAVCLLGLVAVLAGPAHERPRRTPVTPVDAALSWGMVAVAPLSMSIVVNVTRRDELSNGLFVLVAIGASIVGAALALVFVVLAARSAHRPALRAWVASGAAPVAVALGFGALLPLTQDDPGSRLAGLMLAAGAIGLGGLAIRVRDYRDEPSAPPSPHDQGVPESL